MPPLPPLDVFRLDTPAEMYLPFLKAPLIAYKKSLTDEQRISWLFLAIQRINSVLAAHDEKFTDLQAELADIHEELASIAENLGKLDDILDRLGGDQFNWLFRYSQADTWTIRQRVLRTKKRGAQSSKVYRAEQCGGKLYWYQFFNNKDNLATLEILDVETGDLLGTIEGEDYWSHGSMLDIHEDTLIVNNYETVRFYNLANPTAPELITAVNVSNYWTDGYSTSFIFNGDDEMCSLNFADDSYGQPIIARFYGRAEFMNGNAPIIRSVTLEPIPLSQNTSIVWQQAQIVGDYIYFAMSRPEQLACWNINTGEFVYTRKFPSVIGCAKIYEIEAITIIDDTIYVSNNPRRCENFTGLDKYYEQGYGYTTAGLFELNLKTGQDPNYDGDFYSSNDTEGALRLLAYINSETGSLVNPVGYDDRNPLPDGKTRVPFVTVEDALTFADYHAYGRNYELRLIFETDYEYCPRFVGRTVNFQVADGVAVNYFYFQNCNVNFYVPDADNWSFIEDEVGTVGLGYRNRINLRFSTIGYRIGTFPPANNDRPYALQAAYCVYYNAVGELGSAQNYRSLEMI